MKDARAKNWISSKPGIRVGIKVYPTIITVKPAAAISYPPLSQHGDSAGEQTSLIAGTAKILFDRKTFHGLK